MKIYLPLLGIAAGEFMIFFGYFYLGLGVHVINLQAITLTLIFSSFPPEIKKVLQSLLLLLLLRIINMSMPQFFVNTLLWYPFAYGVMFLPIYLIIKNQRTQLAEIGMSLDLKNLPIYQSAALFIGTVMALLEYSILYPTPLIENAEFSNLVSLAIIMVVFVGAVEELIFRSILLTRLEKVLGLWYGLLLSSVIFGIMHSIYGIINEILFASFFGIILGYIFQRTRSLYFILLVRGISNVFLFGLLPFIL